MNTCLIIINIVIETTISSKQIRVGSLLNCNDHEQCVLQDENVMIVMKTVFEQLLVFKIANGCFIESNVTPSLLIPTSFHVIWNDAPISWCR